MTSPDATDPTSAVKGELARATATNPADWHLVFKARYGLELAYQALAEVRGTGTVATQAYTCLTSVTPILAAGLTPVYLDISRDTLAIDTATLKTLTEPPLAVVDQHTMGIIDDEASAALAAAAHDRGALLIEDGAHAVGRMARAADGAPLADVCVYSFGVEKVLPDTRFGGAVWVNPAMADTAVHTALTTSLAALPPIDGKLEHAVKAYRNQSRLLAHMPAGLAKSTSDRWIAKGKREPAVADAERAGRLPLKPMGPGPWVAAEAARDLSHLDENFAGRVETVAAYNEAFAGQDALFIPRAVQTTTQPLLRYPVYAPTREAAETLRANVGALGYYCVAWYRPLLFPGADPVAYHTPDFATLPISAALSEGAVSLPADIGAEGARRVARECLSYFKEV